MEHLETRPLFRLKICKVTDSYLLVVLENDVHIPAQNLTPTYKGDSTDRLSIHNTCIDQKVLLWQHKYSHSQY